MLPGKSVLIATILLAVPCSADWTTAQKEWALGTSAILAKVNGHRYDLLAGTDEPEKLARIKSILEETWGSHSRQDLVKTIRELLDDAESRNKIAWNYPRAVSLGRWGYAVGHITEDEAWDTIMRAALRLQHTFSSWQELGHAYVDARLMFYGNEIAIRRESEWVYSSILLDPASPWRKYAWDLDLGGDLVSANPAKSAELTLAVHPQGLMCVRVRVPDRLDAEDHAYEPYLNAIEKAVGCKPRVTDARYDSKDWILDTECTNNDVLQGARVVATLGIEAIAKELRRDGVTEVFTYVQHEPLGTSVLIPAAQDAYVEGGLQWHASTLSLNDGLPDLTLTYGSAPEKTLPGPDRIRTAGLPGSRSPAGFAIQQERPQPALPGIAEICSGESGSRACKEANSREVCR